MQCALDLFEHWNINVGFISLRKNVFKMPNKKPQNIFFSEAVSNDGDAVSNHTVLCYPVSKVLLELDHMGKTENA